MGVHSSAVAAEEFSRELAEQPYLELVLLDLVEKLEVAAVVPTLKDHLLLVLEDQLMVVEERDRELQPTALAAAAADGVQAEDQQ